MYSEETVLELVELIYSAAGDPMAWSAVLERLAITFQGSAASLHSQNGQSQEASVGAAWNIDPQLIRQYVDYYSPLNPCFTLGRAEIQQGTVKPRQLFCADDVFLRSEFYNDYSMHLNAFHGIVATILEEESTSANLTIFRPKIGQPFGPSEFRFMRMLMPHLQRGFQLHNRIQGLAQKAATAADVLDQLQQGVVLMDAKGQVLLVNQAATTLFTSEKSLRLTPRGLLAALPTENRKLNTLIQGAIATGDGKGLHPGGAMTISRSDFRRPLQVLVTPLRTKTIHLGRDVPVVAVFISDPDCKPASDPAVFRQLFGLTPAESRLAALLASGDNLKDAAERLGVTQGTLRSQLKSIFAKTNTNRQSELVRLVLMIPGKAATGGIIDKDELR